MRKVLFHSLLNTFTYIWIYESNNLITSRGLSDSYLLWWLYIEQIFLINNSYLFLLRGCKKIDLIVTSLIFFFKKASWFYILCFLSLSLINNKTYDTLITIAKNKRWPLTGHVFTILTFLLILQKTVGLEESLHSIPKIQKNYKI